MKTREVLSEISKTHHREDTMDYSASGMHGNLSRDEAYEVRSLFEMIMHELCCTLVR